MGKKEDREDDDDRQMRRLFRRLEKDAAVVRVGKVYVDVPGTVHRLVACSDGLCMRHGKGRKLAGKTCCTTFEVPVETADVERVARIVDEVRKIRDVDEAIEDAGGWWRHDADGLWLEQRPHGACVFLSAPKGGPALCTIHEWAVSKGLEYRDHKPETCCLFPLYTAEWGRKTLVTSYGSAYMLEMEPDQADQLKTFDCTHPAAGIGRPLLVEQHDELVYRFGAKRWGRVLERLRELGHPV